MTTAATETQSVEMRTESNPFEGFFAGRTNESLRIALPLISGLHAFAAVAFWLTLPYEQAIGVAAFSILVTVAAAAATALVRRKEHRFLSPNSLATCVLMLAVCNSFMHILMTWSPLAVTATAILVLATGGLISGRKPLFMAPLAAQGWWALLASADGWTAPWMQLEVALLAASLGAWALYHSRRETATQLFEISQRFETQTQRDPLTGLPIRPALVDRLSECFARESRNEERKFGLCVLNLDGFAKVNLEFGHVKGDLLLQTVAERLRKSCRRSDLVARLGGDEFVILLDETPTLEHAEGGADRLCALSCTAVDLDGAAYEFSASYGVVWSGAGYESEEAMLAAAHAEMQDAKARYHAIAPVIEAHQKQVQTHQGPATVPSMA
jgi:diguanylate cyclase (GGDEF)-like protein